MEIKKRETIYDGFYSLHKLTLEHAGETIVREVFRTGEAVAGLVFHPGKGKFIFVRQYRAGVEEEVTEMVAGLHDDQDTQNLAESLRREIKEETGYAVEHIEPIMKVYPAPGALNEVSHLFYAEVTEQVAEGGGKDEEHENIRVIELTPEETEQQQWLDAKTVIALQWYKLHKPK